MKLYYGKISNNDTAYAYEHDTFLFLLLALFSQLFLILAVITVMLLSQFVRHFTHCAYN